MPTPASVRKIAPALKGVKEADPANFVKFMWGKTPEVIVQLDRIPKKELAVLLREAWDLAARPTNRRKSVYRRAEERFRPPHPSTG